MVLQEKLRTDIINLFRNKAGYNIKSCFISIKDSLESLLRINLLLLTIF